MRYTFDYTVQPDGTAALARVYGEEPVLVLPETLPGPDGQPPAQRPAPARLAGPADALARSGTALFPLHFRLRE